VRKSVQNHRSGPEHDEAGPKRN